MASEEGVQPPPIVVYDANLLYPELYPNFGTIY